MCFRCVVKKFFEILKKKLQHDGKWYYHYDKEGNLTNKTPSPSEKVCESRVCEGMRQWTLGSWAYEWNANGSLKSVKKPSGQTISFEYDALGRRTKKFVKDKTIHYIWSGNVLLHEIFDNGKEQKIATYVYEQGSFVPTAKLIDGESFSIVSDYIGRPILAFDKNGEKVWSAEYDIYGKLTNLQGDKAFIPFRQLGQYEDVETGLYYNRFRYYDCNTGTYVSQDPIGLAGGLSFYAYVHDVNGWVDVFGLSRIPKTGGTWDGIPGNSNWFSNNPKVIGITGGEGIPFKDGLPNFDKWSQGNFEIENMTGGKKDFDLVHQHLKDVGGLKSKAEAKKFLKNNGLTPHHHPDMKTIQLIPSDLHNNIPHEGGASKLRKKGHH